LEYHDEGEFSVTTHTPTFEEIDAAFSKLDVAKHEAALQQFTAATVKTSPASVIGQVCPTYKAVRPFLVAASNLPFIPKKWRDGIKAFIAAVDVLCP